MKKIILLSLLGFLSVSCKKSADNSNDTKIEDSIKKVREQEVINLNVDDSMIFDEVMDTHKLSEKEKKQKENKEAIYSLPTLK